MTLHIPNSFIPGTKAKAQEVNENFNYILEQVSNSASKDFSDLTEEAEKHFVNKNQLTNCILEAPNGVATYAGSTITIKEGLKILIPNGRKADGTLNNIEYTFTNDVTMTAGTGTSCFYAFAGEIFRSTSEGSYIISDNTPKKVSTYATWFSPKDNIMKKTSDGGSSWQTVKCALIGKYTINTSNNQITSFQTQNSTMLAQENELDGSWYYVNSAIATNVSVNGSTKLTYNLSNYFPDDKNLYEIILQGTIEPTTTQNSYGALLVNTSFAPTSTFYLTRARGISNLQNSNGSIANFIIGSDRLLNVHRNTSYQGTVSITLIACRKVR